MTVYSNPGDAPALHFVTKLTVEVAAPLELGAIAGVTRRVIPITGGTFSGPSLKGIVLPGGADYQSVRRDGVVVLEARYTLKTDEGQLISVVNRGFRHGHPDLAKWIAEGRHVPPSRYYFMTTPMFESAAPHLQWLSRMVFVGRAERERTCVLVDVWQVGDEPAISNDDSPQFYSR